MRFVWVFQWNLNQKGMASYVNQIIQKPYVIMITVSTGKGGGHRNEMPPYRLSVKETLPFLTEIFYVKFFRIFGHTMDAK